MKKCPVCKKDIDIEELNINHEYMIYFSKSENPIRISIRQDIERLNCPEDEEIINDFIEDEYGAIYYDIYPLFDEDKIIL